MSVTAVKFIYLFSLRQRKKSDKLILIWWGGKTFVFHFLIEFPYILSIFAFTNKAISIKTCLIV